MANRSELLEKVLKQVEFYFSDSNFPRDKFLREQASQNEEGYVAIKVLISFPRLKALTEDVKLIAESLETSLDLKVNKEGDMVRRISPLPEADKSKDRTIYTKGFPRDGYTIEQVEQVFSTFGKIQCVRIRRTREKQTKESCFVEFSKPEEAKAALSGKPKFQDKELVVMMISDYLQMKKEERKKKIESKQKKRKADDEDTNDNSGKKEGKKEEKRELSRSIITLKNVGPGVTRENIKEIFGEYGHVKFVDFKQNDPEGFVRFNESQGAQKAVEEFPKSKKELGGQVPEIALMSEEAETEYWAKNMPKTVNKKFGKRGKKRRF